MLRFYSLRGLDAMAHCRHSVGMDFEEVKLAVKEAAERKNMELTCHEARKLAEDLDVEYSVVGRACNKVGVRMKHCQWAPWCICEPSLNRKPKDKDNGMPPKLDGAL
jgi:hypothetical protein